MADANTYQYQPHLSSLSLSMFTYSSVLRDILVKFHLAYGRITRTALEALQF